MAVEIGLQQQDPTTWLRWWDDSGNLLLTGDERAMKAEAIADQQSAIADQQTAIATQQTAIANQERLEKQEAEQKSQRLAEKLRSLGVNPDDV